jgi:hypothetical protein
VSWRELVAALVGSPAWPLAVLVVLAVFRRRAAELLELGIGDALRVGLIYRRGLAAEQIGSLEVRVRLLPKRSRPRGSGRCSR